MTMLAKGDASLEAAGMQLTVVGFLGGGGQGEVYRVRGGGREFALKWLYPHAISTKRRAAFRALVDRGMPDGRFLWPAALVSRRGDAASLGYIMPLREPRFVEIKECLIGRVPIGKRLLAKAMAEAADSLWNLHAKGLVYGDLNEGNFFVDPKTGDLQICDNDNVAVERTGRPESSDVIGLVPLMAPEVFRGEHRPNKHTDKHSLAVLFFYMFMYSHPFEGLLVDQIPGWEPTKEMTLYGKPAPFVYHPTDRSNAAVDPEATRRWNELPRFLQQRFREAFVDKVNKPLSRVTGTTWRSDLLKLQGVVVDCPHCGAECYWDGQQPSAAKPMRQCGNDKCRRPLACPPLLRLTRDTSRQILVITRHTRLYSPHIDDVSTFDLRSPKAEVVCHPSDRSRVALRNLSGRPWIAMRPGSSAVSVGPNQVVELIDGLKIQFGRVTGEVRR